MGQYLSHLDGLPASEQWAYACKRCCQTSANQSQFTLARWGSGCTELAPLGESGGTVLLEI